LLGGLYVGDVLSDGSSRRPAPEKDFKPVNPFSELGDGPEPTEISAVRHPDHYYDGMRGHFDFREVPDAVSYEIYVSLSPSGDGAILLGNNVKKSGHLVRGFLANTDNYAFIVWRDKTGRRSRPSKPFRFRLKDEFANK
jgi:hypothetical protein